MKRALVEQRVEQYHGLILATNRYRMVILERISLWKVLLLLIGLSLIIFALIYPEGFSNAKNAGESIQAVVCPAGFWCPISSSGSQQFRCPGGTYGSSPGLSNPACSGFCQPGCVCDEASTSGCQEPCPAGYYCVEGTGGSTPPIICPAGYYCPASSSAPIICPEGKFCSVGTSSI